MAVLNLNDVRAGAPPLYLHPDGRLSSAPDRVLDGVDAGPALITAARWVSGRRTVSFERLFPSSPFIKNQVVRNDALSEVQGRGMLAWLKSVAAVVAANSAAAQKDATSTAQIRSAILTVLSHLTATILRRRDWKAVGEAAADQLLAMVEAEVGPQANAALRAHGIFLLQLRGSALSPNQRQRAATLLRQLVRTAPPYDTLKGPWHFAMCSAWDFHEGECDILQQRGYKEVPTTIAAPRGSYRCFEAPFKNPNGEAVRILARSATPTDENLEMANPALVGMLINRHAQLGSFDMRASAGSVQQQGYKMMMNSQCAGLTTRFAIARLFPEADIYSSWDSTYFRTGPNGRMVASEGLDCFLALLQGMAQKESHAQLADRMKKVQWRHEQSSNPSFYQFVGPAHPQVMGRYQDVNQDGRADMYDGFLDLNLKGIAENLYQAGTPKDPGVSASAIGGDAATGLGWAVGSLNRVTAYSELWDELPGTAEGMYTFSAGGFFDQRTAPVDVPGVKEDAARLPAICHYKQGQTLSAEVSFHAWLADAPRELKRLLVTAEAMNRAYDLGILKATSPLNRRAAILLTLAGLLEYPSDQNQLDALWSISLKMLNFPEVSRSTVRSCLTDEDHARGNYYGSRRGIRQLVGDGATERGSLGTGDPAAWTLLASADPAIGRAKLMMI